MEARLLEGDAQEFAGGLGGVAVPGVVRVEDPADLAQAVLGVAEDQQDVPDDGVVEVDGEDECVVPLLSLACGAPATGDKGRRTSSTS